MADHAVNISESGLYLIANPFIGSYSDLPAMGENTVAMLKDAINAFVNEDVAMAQAVCDRDNIVDDAGGSHPKRADSSHAWQERHYSQGLSPDAHSP